MNLKLGFRGGAGGHLGLRNLSDTQTGNLYVIMEKISEMFSTKRSAWKNTSCVWAHLQPHFYSVLLLRRLLSFLTITIAIIQPAIIQSLLHICKGNPLLVRIICSNKILTHTDAPVANQCAFYTSIRFPSVLLSFSCYCLFVHYPSPSLS